MNQIILDCPRLLGFRASDVSVSRDDNQLVIRGRKNEFWDRTFPHRGIGFVRAEGLEVLRPQLDPGLLFIELKRDGLQPMVCAIPSVQPRFTPRMISMTYE